MSNTILITGATGNTASLLIPMLQKAGVEVRGLAHSEEKAEALRQKGVKAFAGEFDDQSVLAEGMDGGRHGAGWLAQGLPVDPCERC